MICVILLIFAATRRVCFGFDGRFTVTTTTRSLLFFATARRVFRFRRKIHGDAENHQQTTHGPTDWLLLLFLQGFFMFALQSILQQCQLLVPVEIFCLLVGWLVDCLYLVCPTGRPNNKNYSTIMATSWWKSITSNTQRRGRRGIDWAVRIACHLILYY
jgi:hypothetical protein